MPDRERIVRRTWCDGELGIGVQERDVGRSVAADERGACRRAVGQTQFDIVFAIDRMIDGNEVMRVPREAARIATGMRVDVGDGRRDPRDGARDIGGKGG